MNYTSVVFIFIFLPTVLLGLWILKKLRVKNNIISGYLLAASLVFTDGAVSGTFSLS